MMPRYEVTVQITTQDTTTAEVSEYVEDAVKGWGGAFEPEHPFCGDNKHVRIMYAKMIRKKSASPLKEPVATRMKKS